MSWRFHLLRQSTRLSYYAAIITKPDDICTCHPDTCLLFRDESQFCITADDQCTCMAALKGKDPSCHLTQQLVMPCVYMCFPSWHSPLVQSFNKISHSTCVWELPASFDLPLIEHVWDLLRPSGASYNSCGRLTRGEDGTAVQLPSLLFLCTYSGSGGHTLLTQDQQCFSTDNSVWSDTDHDTVTWPFTTCRLILFLLLWFENSKMHLF